MSLISLNCFNPLFFQQNLIILLSLEDESFKLYCEIFHIKGGGLVLGKLGWTSNKLISPIKTIFPCWVAILKSFLNIQIL